MATMPWAGAAARNATGATRVTTAAVLAWEPMVGTARVVSAVTFGDALVGSLAAATSRGRDALAAAGAVVLAALTETAGLVPPLAGEPSLEDLRRGVDRTCADVEELDRVVAALLVVAVALLAEVLGLDAAVVVPVRVLCVPFTAVFAPPEACTTPVPGSVDDD